MKKEYLPPVLETERVLLRPLSMDDKPSIYKWASDPRVSKFMLYSNYNSPDDANIWLENIYSSEGTLDYAFVWKETGEVIGSGGLIYHADGDYWTIGYNIRHDMWGKGIVTEICKKVIEYARAHYDVKRIEGTFAQDNPASGRIMEKLGMTYREDTEYEKFDKSASFKAKIYEIVYEG